MYPRCVLASLWLVVCVGKGGRICPHRVLERASTCVYDCVCVFVRAFVCCACIRVLRTCVGDKDKDVLQAKVTHPITNSLRVCLGFVLRVRVRLEW
jgi:hypothetical protein